MEQDWTRIEGMIIGRDIDPALVATALREQAVLAQLEWFPSSPQLLGVNVAHTGGRVALVKNKKVLPGPTTEKLVYEIIIAASAIRVNNAFKFHAAPDDPLEGDHFFESFASTFNFLNILFFLVGA